MADSKVEYQVNVYLTERQYDALKRMCDYKGISKSVLVRTLILKEIRHFDREVY